jgi:hypothetical protein
VTLQKRNILGDPLPTVGSPDEPAPPPLSTAGGLDSEITRQRDPAAAYHQARTVASRFVGSGASGVQLGRGDDTFSVTGSTPDRSSTTTGGTDPLVTRTDDADDGTQFGKALG